jgi:hypothetical protein
MSRIIRGLIYFSLASASASGMVWNFKHGYFYWAAYLGLCAIDGLLLQYHRTGDAEILAALGTANAASTEATPNAGGKEK